MASASEGSQGIDLPLASELNVSVIRNKLVVDTVPSPQQDSDFEKCKREIIYKANCGFDQAFCSDQLHDSHYRYLKSREYNIRNPLANIPHVVISWNR